MVCLALMIAINVRRCCLISSIVVLDVCWINFLASILKGAIATEKDQPMQVEQPEWQHLESHVVSPVSIGEVG